MDRFKYTIFSLFAAGLLLFVSVGGCSDPEGARRVLRTTGFTDVEITGWRPMAASKNDFYSTGFRAKSPTGERVTGVVTRGLFSSYTVRLD